MHCTLLLKLADWPICTHAHTHWGEKRKARVFFLHQMIVVHWRTLSPSLSVYMCIHTEKCVCVCVYKKYVCNVCVTVCMYIKLLSFSYFQVGVFCSSLFMMYRLFSNTEARIPSFFWVCIWGLLGIVSPCRMCFRFWLSCVMHLTCNQLLKLLLRKEDSQRFHSTSDVT